MYFFLVNESNTRKYLSYTLTIVHRRGIVETFGQMRVCRRQRAIIDRHRSAAHCRCWLNVRNMFTTTTLTRLSCVPYL